MKAIPLLRVKPTYAKGIVEINTWQVQTQALPCAHCYKYRLVYVVESMRLIGYDNERGKGDHCYDDELEMPYEFSDVSTLLADFWQAVDKKLGVGQ